jgi:hypothetical protein
VMRRAAIHPRRTHLPRILFFYQNEQILSHPLEAFSRLITFQGGHSKVAIAFLTQSAGMRADRMQRQRWLREGGWRTDDQSCSIKEIRLNPASSVAFDSKKRTDCGTSNRQLTSHTASIHSAPRDFGRSDSEPTSNAGIICISSTSTYSAGMIP